MNQLEPVRKSDTQCKHCNDLIYWDADYMQWYHIYEGHPIKRCTLPPQNAEPLYRGDAHEIRQEFIVSVRDTKGNSNHIRTHRFTDAESVAEYIDRPNTTVYEIIKRPYVPE